MMSLIRRPSSCAFLTLGLTCVLAMSACTSQPPVTPPMGTADVGPGGGEVKVVGDEGVVYNLTVPAGALAETVTLTLEPRAPAAGEILAMYLEPADLIFAAPATLRVTLPAGTDLDGLETFVLGGAAAPVFLVSEANGGTLSADLRFFVVPADGSTVPLLAAASEEQSPPTLSPQQAGDGIAILLADCERKLNETKHSYDLFVGSESFEAAIRIAFNGAALASTCGDFDAAVEFIELTTPGACARYEELVQNAQVIAADDYDVFTEVTQPITLWSATLQNLGAECAAAASPSDVIASKLSQYLTFYAGKLQDLPQEHDALMAEARKIVNLMGQASLLGLDALQDQLRSSVLNPVMDMLRDAAYAECRKTVDHYYLYSLLEAPFASQRVPIVPLLPAATVVLQPQVLLPQGHASFEDNHLVEDIQRCASYLTVEVWPDTGVPEELTSQRVELVPAEAAGEHVWTAQAEGPVEGHLVLRGPVEVMRCGQGRSLVAHELVVKSNQREVHRAQTLDANPEIDVKAALEADGLSTEHVNDLLLTVVREFSSGECAILYGGPKFELFEVTYTADPAPNVNAVAATPSGIPAEQDIEITFALDWFDDGENLKTLHVEYQLGDATATAVAELASAADATGFTGKQGGGLYVAEHFVYCSEEGEGPLIARFVLEDEYGQKSEAGQVSIPVSFAGCAQAGSDGPAAPDRRGLIVMGEPR